jgi:hypothetical protein
MSDGQPRCAGPAPFDYRREVRLSEGDRSRRHGNGRRQSIQPRQLLASVPMPGTMSTTDRVPSRQLGLSAQRSWFAVTGEAPTAARGPAMRIRDAAAAGLGSLPCGAPVKRRARPRCGRCAATWGANHGSSFLVGGADRHRGRGRSFRGYRPGKCSSFFSFGCRTKMVPNVFVGEL